MPNLDLFTRDYLNNSTFGKMAYMQGWQPNIADSNYDYLKAILSGSGPGINWDSNGNYGAQWHWPSKTPGGDWLKEESHPSRWREEESGLQELMNRLF